MTEAVAIPFTHSLVPSAFVNVVDPNGFTSFGVMYSECTTEQDAPESSNILALNPLIFPVT